MSVNSQCTVNQNILSCIENAIVRTTNENVVYKRSFVLELQQKPKSFVENPFCCYSERF